MGAAACVGPSSLLAQVWTVGFTALTNYVGGRTMGTAQPDSVAESSFTGSRRRASAALAGSGALGLRPAAPRPVPASWSRF